jgi:hypothetical protein
MDGSRTRRIRDPIRKAWYASHRQRRFARRYGFGVMCVRRVDAGPLDPKSAGLTDPGAVGWKGGWNSGALR